MKSLHWFAFSVLVLGLFLNQFIKDSIWPLSAIYYALPVKVLLMVSAGYCAISFRAQIHRITAPVLFIAIIVLYCTSESGFIEGAGSPDLVCWNTEYGKLDHNEFIEFIRKQDAEVYIFMEFSGKIKEFVERDTFAELVPEYDPYLLPGKTAIFVRSGTGITYLGDEDASTHHFNFIEINGLIIAIVDINSNPLMNREKAFARLETYLNSLDIVCGDFNTPYDSVHFSKLKELFVSGRTEVETKRDTWPSYLPVLSLDHVFVAKRLGMRAYCPERICLTDHFPVKVYLGKSN